MELYRKIRSTATKMSPSPGKQTSTYNVNNQGLATLLVMIAVLTIIILFCCFAAPGIRDICRKYCRCRIDNPDRDASSQTGNSTPTIILLPYGRMLVVDRSVFSHLRADPSGIDFMELSANMIRAQRAQDTPDSDTTSKGRSHPSLGASPPAYDDIFGGRDLPPSYSELSITLKCFGDLSAARGKEEQGWTSCPDIGDTDLGESAECEVADECPAESNSETM